MRPLLFTLLGTLLTRSQLLRASTCLIVCRTQWSMVRGKTLFRGLDLNKGAQRQRKTKVGFGYYYTLVVLNGL